MPFIAELDDDRVIPEGIEDGEDVFCIHCEGRMRARGPMDDGRARHFFHVDNLGHGDGGGGCEGGGVGESEIHRKYKSHAVGRLRQLYPNFIEFCRPEQRLSTILGDDFVELPSGKEDRQADAMMLLEDPTRMFGRGLIVEVQYRNLGKNIEETTRDYLANGFSVLWVDEGDFESDRCLLTKKQIRCNTISVWPNAVPLESEWGGGKYGAHDLLRSLKEDLVLTETVRFTHREFGVPAVRPVPASAVPATLPNEFFDEIARDVKRLYDWDDLFKPPEDYSPPWGYSKVPATLPPEWHSQKAREFWQYEPWSKRFWLDHLEKGCPLKYVEPEPTVQAEIPLTKFIIDEPDLGYYHSILRRAYFKANENSRNEQFWLLCNECGSGRQVTVVGGMSDGMVGYAKTLECEACGTKTWHSP